MGHRVCRASQVCQNEEISSRKTPRWWFFRTGAAAVFGVSSSWTEVCGATKFSEPVSSGSLVWGLFEVFDSTNFSVFSHSDYVKKLSGPFFDAHQLGIGHQVKF